MRANEPGVVLGRALEPYSAGNPDDTAQIAAALNIHFAVVTDETGSVPRSIGSQVRRALVTGAARGIGLATTQLFIEQGWRVAMVDRDGDELHKASAGLNEASATLVDRFAVHDKPDAVEQLMGH